MYPLLANSGDTSYGDVKYWFAAEDAIERAWWEDPALPGMKSTGAPCNYYNSVKTSMLRKCTD